MSRIPARFGELQATGRTALVSFITAGDPQPTLTVDLMHAMVKAGADILELGVPFSDPMADGPVIQLATERALAHGVSLNSVLDMVREFRQQDDQTPIVLMGYLNPVEVMGYATFAERAAAAGVDGVITVDLPPEEGNELVSALKAHQVAPVFLLSPTSTEERIRKITQTSEGFVYYVSFKGVTGANQLDVQSVACKLDEIRQLSDLPIGVGFGIRDAESAAAVAAVADAVVVGSAVVKCIENNLGNNERILSEITELLSAMRNAMDR